MKVISSCFCSFLFWKHFGKVFLWGACSCFFVSFFEALIDFPSVITTCGAITGVSENFVILMDVFPFVFTSGCKAWKEMVCWACQLDPVIPQPLRIEKIWVLTLLLAIGIFMMQMVWVWLFFVALFYTQCRFFLLQSWREIRMYRFSVQRPEGKSSTHHWD